MGHIAKHLGRPFLVSLEAKAKSPLARDTVPVVILAHGLIVGDVLVLSCQGWTWLRRCKDLGDSRDGGN